MGGVAIFLSLCIGLLMLYMLQPALLASTWLVGWEGRVLLIVLAFVLAIGITDDIRSLKPAEKFGVS
jgi:UDP-N-acetylmuramyl pentapeptide phosphotransferase/UDP-N-acetylglucosamine-1-phosphate transferase